MFFWALILCQIWLYLSQSLFCMFVGFNVRVECESLVKNCVDSEVRDLLVTDSQRDNCEKSREKHMLEIE